MEIDPVCKMEVDEKSTAHTLHYGHETFYFCSEGCKDTYQEKMGLKKAEPKKGFMGRFLENLAEGTHRATGGKPPKCH